MSLLTTWIRVNLLPHGSTVLVIVASLFMAACSDDDDKFSADVEKAVGTYLVEDTAEWGDVESYTITIKKSSAGGPHVEITNFGDIMYVPIKGVVSGNQFRIPAQTFSEKKMTITISGEGEFEADGTLEFDYVIDVDNGSLLEHTCVAVKQTN
jgi:nitrogen fixation protein FixH